tara:strand:+ start:113 stop:367 length:255 start_codon:yes stop_codon:yes gene_type:complete
VSTDSVEDNTSFAGNCGFSYPLICDQDLAVSIAYGAAKPGASSSSRIAVLVKKEDDGFGTVFNVDAVWMKVDARAFPGQLLASL